MTRFLPSRLRIAGLALLGLMLAACASVPAPGPWTAAQRETLTANGFVESGDNWLLNIGDRLLFEVDKSDLNGEQAVRLQNLAGQLIKVGITTAQVEGHTDNTGSTEHNLILSKARAMAVAIPLQQGGMALDPAKIIGRGESDPLSPNNDAEGRRDNRRVAILISPAN